MNRLDAAADELLGLFPRAAPRLYLATPDPVPGQLHLIYAQRAHPDEARDWTAFYTWQQDLQAWMLGGCAGEKPLLPSSFDELYFECLGDIATGHIAKDDRILLRVDLSDRARNEPLPDGVVALEMIRRNGAAEDLRGLGSQFYHGLIGWLAERGYRYLIGTPASPEIAAYWRSQGQVPLRDVPELAERLPGKDPDAWFVHRLLPDHPAGLEERVA